ncbi:fused MFS/spermidine synthase [Candidatus Gracilibacteria bacterium]|nr:fused MFS/spermidine synthase [Candidatus Gracilibacteria bacterium]
MHIIISLIAFLEGFTTLSIEIIALRKFTPVIGSNSISTSIILGVILLALSYGYYIGGQKSIHPEGVKKRIIRNLILASLYYVCFTFIFDIAILKSLLSITNSYFFSILLSSIILFFIPIFLASQTIPLLAEIYKGTHIGETIGKLLFFSTIGSFFGSVLTSSFLFSILGVYKAALLNSFILATLASVCAYMFIRNTKTFWIILAINLFIGLNLITPQIKNSYTIYSGANAYHNIDIYDRGDQRIFSQNGAYSSGLNIATGKSFFWYITEAVSQTLLDKPNSILVIGAAGFTYPDEVSSLTSIKTIEVVDVDATLKEVSEKYFLEKKLSNKIKFYPVPARAHLNNAKQQSKTYDIIFVDAYSGNALPPQMLTKEFFDSIQDLSTYQYLNVITDGSLESNFSQKLFSTLHHSWGDVYYKQLDPNKTEITNFIITNKYSSDYIKYEKTMDSEIYTDDKNSIEVDLFEQRSNIWR